MKIDGNQITHMAPPNWGKILHSVAGAVGAVSLGVAALSDAIPAVKGPAVAIGGIALLFTRLDRIFGGAPPEPTKP